MKYTKIDSEDRIIFNGEDDIILSKRKGSLITLEGFKKEQIEIKGFKGYRIKGLSEAEKVKLTNKVLDYIWR